MYIYIYIHMHINVYTHVCVYMYIHIVIYTTEGICGRPGADRTPSRLRTGGFRNIAVPLQASISRRHIQKNPKQGLHFET